MSVFQDMAEHLAEQIWGSRVQARDGSITWIRPGSEGRGEPVSLRLRVDPFLYDGTAGIALFLAALARVTRSDKQRSRSLETLVPLRRKMADLMADPERAARLQNLGIGGFIGLGSLIYSFLKIGRLLDEPDLVEDAQGLMALLTLDRIAHDTACDVLYGSAGALLALVALHRGLPVPDRKGSRALEIASACARHLLARQQSFDGGPRTWQTIPGFPPLFGFSHGAGGICSALLRLWEQTRETELLRAAEEGLEFEARLYSPAHRSWRDPRFATEVFKTGWCNGAAGAALARIASLPALDTAALRADIANGLATTLSTPLTAVDHVCCGNLGRVEVLLEASVRRGDEELRQAAELLAWSTLERAAATGSFAWRNDMAPGLFDPTFFTGAAGIGYTLLRLADPNGLPCLLLLD